MVRQPSYINVSCWEWEYLFVLKIFLVICITSYSSIIFPVQDTFIAILPVHSVLGKENILNMYNLKKKSIYYLFQWKK